MAKPKIVVLDPFEDYRAEAAASPSNAQAQANLGWGYYAKGKYDEAVAQFNKALQVDRDNFDAAYGLGLALRKIDKKDEALSALEHALTLAANTENKARTDMLERMIDSHMNWLKSGKWYSGKAIIHK